MSAFIFYDMYFQKNFQIKSSIRSERLFQKRVFYAENDNVIRFFGRV